MLGNPAVLGQLRELLTQNPAALQPLLQQIAGSNPALAQALQEHPEEVMERLNQVMGMLGGEGGAEGLEELLGDDYENAGEAVQLTPEDQTNIEQITAMGIPHERAVMAYVMCGKNVEMAIQYYFENADEFDEGP